MRWMTTRRKNMQRAVVSVAYALLLGSAQSVAADIHKSPHLEETKQLVGIKGIGASGFEDGKSEFGGGFGVFYERTVIEGWLELEFNPSFLWVEGKRVVSTDVLAKKSFFAHESVNPYVGLGPAVVVTIGDEKTKTRFGLSAAVGSYFWPWERVGFDFDVVYTVQLTSGIVHELTLQFGPVVRF